MLPHLLSSPDFDTTPSSDPPTSLAFDQDFVPDTLLADDPIDQSSILNSVTSPNTPTGYSLEDYERVPVTPVRASVLRDMYEARRTNRALKTLQQKTKLNIDDNLRHYSDDPDLHWTADSHFVDHMLVVPSLGGFQAIIPTDSSDHRYVFQLDFSRRNWAFPSRDRAELGFDSTGRMLHIGQCRGDNVWLGWVPRNCAGKNIAPEDVTLSGPSTRMAPAHARFTIALLAYLLDKAGTTGVYIMDDYPRLEGEGEGDALLRMSNNIMYVIYHNM